MGNIHMEGNFNPYSLNSWLHPNGTHLILYICCGKVGGEGGRRRLCVWNNLTSTASKIPQEKNISEILKLLYPFFKKQIR